MREEVLKLAKEMMEKDPSLTEWISTKFPELKEYGDERIREAIRYAIGQSTHSDGTLINGVSSEEALNWLEKQGNNINCIYDKELSELLHIVICRYINDPDISYSERENVSKKILPYIELLEKQGKQKPVWSEEDEGFLNLLLAIFTITHPNDVFSTVDMPVFKGKCVTSDRIIVWLKSLKDRVQPQPKQEWKQENTDDLTDFENSMMHIGESFFGQHAGLDPNDTNVIKEQANLLLELVPNKEWGEEDEDLLKCTINNLTELEQRFGKDYGKVGECINWIKQRHWKKSLKTVDLENSLCDIQDGYSDTSYEYRVLGEAIEFIRGTDPWKPSDEQMDAVKSAALDVAKFSSRSEQLMLENEPYYKALVSLYNDLKKLREE